MHLPQTLVLSSFFLLLLLVVLEPYSSCRAADVPDLKACGFTAIYCFGDSIYDTGNNNVQFPGSVTATLPYGITIGKPNGRFSDGFLIIDRIAEAAGLPHTAPYLNKKFDHSKGANFAVGGTGLLTKQQRLQWNVTLPYSQSSIEIQLQWFDQLVKEEYKDEKVRRDNMKSSLFVLGGGNIDYVNLNYACNLSYVECRKLIIPDEVKALKDGVKTLRSYGGNTFVINGIYQGGCLPNENATSDVTIACSSEWQEWHNNHNKAVQKGIQELRKEFPDTRIVYGDIWAAHQWLFDHALSQGFNNLNKACCKGCSKGVVPCPNPSQYIYWDAGHLTDHSYKLMADVMIPQISQGLQCHA